LKVGSQPVCIGRAAGNRIRIDDTSISRVHCSFALRSNAEIVLADLNSSNGTLVNDEQLNPNEARAIQQGDEITFGDIHLTVIEII
jgi:pSer/pThr/pTyr-binding forkhead associated (FHA) protein